MCQLTNTPTWSLSVSCLDFIPERCHHLSTSHILPVRHHTPCHINPAAPCTVSTTKIWSQTAQGPPALHLSGKDRLDTMSAIGHPQSCLFHICGCQPFKYNLQVFMIADTLSRVLISCINLDWESQPHSAAGTRHCYTCSTCTPSSPMSRLTRPYSFATKQTIQHFIIHHIH